MKSPSAPITDIADNPNKCLVSSSSSEWVIDSEATDHMIGNLSFNLMSMSKLTRALNCYISFFLDFCLFQDLMTKEIIGTFLVPRHVACSGVTTPFETHC